MGIGAAGAEALTSAARSAIAGAERVFGSARQLALVSGLVGERGRVWPSPLAEGMAEVLAARGRAVCVLASGDPFFYGIGATLAPALAPGEFVCHPAPSSVSLAASRLGWPLQDTDVVSLHGRDLAGIHRHLAPGRRLFALSWDERTPAALAALLVSRGFGRSRMHVLEHLDGPEERIRTTTADAFELTGIAKLNLVGLALDAAPGSFVIPRAPGLPDDAFEHDGQLTKCEVRALTLAALAPRPGELLWDVGAGAGSIAIEWMLSHPACRAFAIEEDAARVARIGRNARALGVPALAIVHASAPSGLAQLPQPDAVFIGGGGGDPAVFARCFEALRPGGRLVVNAVSLETEAQLYGLHAAHGGTLCRVLIERAGKLGAMTGFRPAMPVTQWRVSKPS